MSTELPFPLVETSWLAGNLGEPDLVVLDGSWHMPATGRDAEAEYQAAHIPGAIRFDIDAVSDPRSGLPHTLPGERDFSGAVGRLGIGDNMRIVVYETDGPFSAPRVWWMFRVMGAKRVSVLDGGLRKWRAEDRPVETGAVVRPETRFTARLDVSLLRRLDDMRGLVADGSAQVIDARSPGRFSGTEPEPRPGVRPGHMPGAVNMHYASFAKPDGTFKDARAIAGMFADAGIDTGQPLATTCGSGVTAAIPLFALALLGKGNAALYDGSWSEWGGAGDTPVETGSCR